MYICATLGLVSAHLLAKLECNRLCQCSCSDLGSKGNSHLKTIQHTSFKVAYTWMPYYQFSLNASVYWEAILKDIVPYWHEQDGLMVNEKSIAGTPTRFTSTSSLRPICSTASCSCRPRFRIAASGTPVCTI